MCGIAGATHADPDVARAAVDAMCNRMVARGPDDAGVVVTGVPGQAVVFGNRRLAIIDPTPAGHQPMTDERGNAIVFNGMVYNFRELRDQLIRDGERFASDCDTEVVLRAYGRFGERCVDYLRGMFAFAVWDRNEGQLVLARDRLGIKPLYYNVQGSALLFGSQVKALVASGRVNPRLSLEGIASFLSFGAVGEPLTAVQEVYALPAGHTAVWRDGRLRLRPYWNMPEPGAASTFDTAARELRELLHDSVRRHLVSDARVGVFLSGGLDSSVIAALAAREARQLRTISVSFDEIGYAEGSHAEHVARHVGAEHTELRLRPHDLLQSLDQVFTAMDQPTFDGVNTWAVSQAAAGTGLKVALSGLGADELFDGYGNVSRSLALERVARIPAPLARAAGYAAARFVSGNREKLQAWVSGRAGGYSSYELLRSLFLQHEVVDLVQVAPRPRGEIDVISRDDAPSRLTVLDLSNYTRNVLLRDTDAMSMAHSLEVRVPYLDDRIVEWALRLPAGARGRGQKALLAAVARDLLPASIAGRKKQGFALPLAAWMRDELRSEVDATLREPSGAIEDVIDRSAAVAIWDRFQQDGRRWLRPWALYALSRWAVSLREQSAVAA